MSNKNSFNETFLSFYHIIKLWLALAFFPEFKSSRRTDIDTAPTLEKRLLGVLAMGIWMEDLRLSFSWEFTGKFKVE